MGEMMQFPKTVEEFMQQYKLTDTQQVYTNGTELVPISRMKQWFEAHEQRWIPCSEQLPMKCGKYLVAVESEAFPGDSYIDTLTYDKFGWRDGCCYVNGVSHWMPLPKLPTRKDDDEKGE